MIVYQVVDWDQFENNKSREREALTWYVVPNTITAKVKRLFRLKDGATAYAVHHLILGLCSRQKRPRAGWLTDDGTPDGDPLSSSDLAREFSLPVPVIRTALQALSSPRIGWLKGHETGSQVPAEAPGSRAVIWHEHGQQPAEKVPSEVKVKYKQQVQQKQTAVSLDFKNAGREAPVVTANNPAQTAAPRSVEKFQEHGSARHDAFYDMAAWRGWNTFAEVLRAWGFGEENSRRVVKYLRDLWSMYDTPPAPDDFWRVLCKVKYTQDRYIGIKCAVVLDQAAYVIRLIREGRDLDDLMPLAKAAWEQTEANLTKAPADPPAWLAEALGGVGRDVAPEPRTTARAAPSTGSGQLGNGKELPVAHEVST